MAARTQCSDHPAILPGFRARPVPRDVLGYAELATEIAEKNPLWSPDLVQSVIRAAGDEIMDQLIVQKNEKTRKGFRTGAKTEAYSLNMR